MYFDLHSAVGLPTLEPRVNLCPQQMRKMKGNGLVQGHLSGHGQPNGLSSQIPTVGLCSGHWDTWLPKSFIDVHCFLVCVFPVRLD